MHSLISPEERVSMMRLRLVNEVVREEFAVREACSVAGVDYEPRLVADSQLGGEADADECCCADHPLLVRVYLALAGIAPFARYDEEPLAYYAGSKTNRLYAGGYVNITGTGAFEVPMKELRKAARLRREVCPGHRRFDAERKRWYEAGEHFPEPDRTHTCLGEDPAAEHEKWDGVELMKRTFDHLGSRYGIDPWSPSELIEAHENRDRIEGCWDGDDDPERSWIVAGRDSTDLLDVIRAQEAADEELHYQANVTWSEVTVTKVDPASFPRKRGRELTDRARTKNEMRDALARTKAVEASYERIVALVTALGGDPQSREVETWLEKCISTKKGSVGRGYGLALDKLERRLAATRPQVFA